MGCRKFPLITAYHLDISFFDLQPNLMKCTQPVNQDIPAKHSLFLIRKATIARKKF
jgi:hypothetical protein